MTQPPGRSTDTTPNEVIARVSVDIPPDTEANVHQLRQSIDNLRAGVEAASRSAGDFYEHLSSLPDIAARAGAAVENLSQTVVASKDHMQRGTGPNQNNAPSKFVDSFADATSGVGRGRIGTADQAEAYLQNLKAQDPRAYANYASARGMPVAPQEVAQAMLAPTLGRQPIAVPGATPEPVSRDSSREPVEQQAVRERRQSEAVPESTTRSERETKDLARSLVNEMKTGGYGPGVNMPSPGDSGGGGLGGLFDGFGGAGAGGLGSILSKAGFPGAGGALGAAGGVGTALAVAAVLYKITQMVGEQAARLEKMGSVSGQGIAAGITEEADARKLALSPYLTLEEARDITQTMTMAGYKGKDRDVVERYMTDNMTNMNMSASESANLLNVYEQGGYTTQEAVEAARRQLAVEKEIARTSNRSLPEIRASAGAYQQQLVDSGVDPSIAASRASQAASAFSSTNGLEGVMEFLGGNLNRMGMRMVLEHAGFDMSKIDYETEEEYLNDERMIWEWLRSEAQQTRDANPNKTVASQAVQFKYRIRPFFSSLPSRMTIKQLYIQLIGLKENEVPQGGDTPDEARKNPEVAKGEYELPRPSDSILESLRPSIGPDGVNIPIVPGVVSIQGGPDGVSYEGPLPDIAGGWLEAGKHVLGKSWETVKGAFDFSSYGASAAAADTYGVPGDGKNGPRKVKADVRPVAYETPLEGQQTQSYNFKKSDTGQQAAAMAGVLKIQGDQRLLKALGLPDQIEMTANQLNAMSGWGRATINNPPPGDR